MTFKQELAHKLRTVNTWIEALSPRGSGLHSAIYTAANYSISAGGKRIRPILALAVNELLGGAPDQIRNFACAVEFIHTYSLIHDDLPCMDDDELRRGMPTNHKKFGEALALLAGDALLTYAFEVAAAAPTAPEITVRAIGAIAQAAGANGMIGGQVIDIEGAKTYDALQTVHQMKTGALIRLSCYLGCLAGGATDAQTADVDRYAAHLGVAFQIKDDLLDVESSSDELGKPVGSDEKRGLCTYTTLFGVEGAKKHLTRHTQAAQNALAPFGANAGFLIELSNYLLNRKN